MPYPHPSTAPNGHHTETHHFASAPWALLLTLLLLLSFPLLLWTRPLPFQAQPTLARAFEEGSSRCRPRQMGAARAYRFAGSGSNLPLMRWLLTQHTSAPSISLAESIGSTGGIRAVYEGAIDIALLSRPLRRHEKRFGLVVLPYTRVPVVFAAHPRTPIRGLSGDALLSLYRGEKLRWSDGSPVLLFQRERGDSGNEAVIGVLPSFQAVNEQAYQSNRWRVLYRDEAMQAMLSRYHGSIGLFDLGAIRIQALSLRPLAYEGVEPSPEALENLRYPFAKDLSFAYCPPLSASLAAFFEEIQRPRWREKLYRYGYLPLFPPSSHPSKP